MSDAFIAVGSNIEYATNIPAALRHLKSLVSVRATSKFYRAAAVGSHQQLPYANGVWHIDTNMAPHSLKFDVCRAVESLLGRVRTADRFAARPIDLDLLLYDDLVVNETGLILPAPEIRTRSFVAVPLMELTPGRVLPDTGEFLSSLPVSTDPALEVITGLTDVLRRMIHEP
jgi:2-amino-4-hydroxy-6-hydroxymethyldihydropteridine diphosphokinase